MDTPCHTRLGPWPAVLDLCLEAGRVIARHYGDRELNERLRSKSDDSPLTRADLASHRLLHDGLAVIDASTPLLSEESPPEAIAGRRQWSRCWMVDPLDGTREFLERTGQFTINVALIEGQRPVAGLVYAPLAQHGSLGIVGEGAWLCEWTGTDWTYATLETRALPPDRLTMLSSHRHRNPRLDLTLDLLSRDRELDRANSGSALKFCDLAAGRGDIYPRFSPCSEWDVAAGDALVTAAGGAVLGLDGLPLRYNARDTLLNAPFLAVGDPGQSLWATLLSAVGSLPSGAAG